MQIRTARLVVRPLSRADVDAIAVWRPFAEPLLSDYNPPPDETEGDRDKWFTVRTGDSARQEFAVTETSGRLLGRISLRQIDRQGNARLGIMIGAEYVDRGYGSEALAGFLDWYFGEGGFVKIVLDVSAANTRAVHVYNKLGFRQVMQWYEPLSESDAAFLDDPRYANVRQYFRRESAQAWALFYEMELTRPEWRTYRLRP